MKVPSFLGGGDGAPSTPSDIGDVIPAVPAPDMMVIAGAIVRGIIQILSGFGFTWALTVNGSQIQMAVTALAMVLTLVWSALQKYSAQRGTYLAAVASASKRKPVEPGNKPPPPV